MAELKVETQAIDVNMIGEDMVEELVEFLKNEEEYLDTGLGAFHTDNHGNW